ncbi:DUF1643 domain-containing protein [bacterium]|nr:DUF1643 domain-containing protein [bacterium]
MGKLNWLKQFDSNEWLYQGDETTARFSLGRLNVKKDIGNPLVCFGINPSVARPDLPDATLIRVENYAYKHGYDGWLMLNIYPQRATDPNKLLPTLDGDLHSKNMDIIGSILKKGSLKLWVAWGEMMNKRSYLAKCLSDIENVARINNCCWVSLGKTAECYPVHPLNRSKGFRLYETVLSDYTRAD